MSLNKHLIKIITNYIEYSTYQKELLNKTKSMLEPHVDNWYYYKKYIICKEEYKYTYSKFDYLFIRGYRFNREYYISKMNNKWFITTI